MRGKFKKMSITFFSVIVISCLCYNLNQFMKGKVFAEMSEGDSQIVKTSTVSNIQKVKLGEKFSPNLSMLFPYVKMGDVKLKTNVLFDSTKIGFQWVDITSGDQDLKIPVNVYDPNSTVFNDVDGIALNAKNIRLTFSEMELALKEKRINELILQQSEASSWQIENGEEATVTVNLKKNSIDIGSQEAIIRATRKDTNKILEKKIEIFIEEPFINDGWETVSATEAISNVGFKIQWNNGAWWYTYMGAQWIYNNSIEANIIVNGAFPPNTSDETNRTGFLWKTESSLYEINRKEKALKRTFTYLSNYKIEIIQQLLENDAAEITYRVTNIGKGAQKIGISQFADTFVGSDSVPVTPINNFKGINLTSGNSSLVILPDEKTMPNWAAGLYNKTSLFKQYNVQDANGIGWETGKRYRNAAGVLFYPEAFDIKENESIYLGDSGVSMKNPGVMVASNESVSFKQTLKYGALQAPKITLNQTKEAMYQNEKIIIDGTIRDIDNKNYRVYLEMDDKDKTLIPLADFKDIPYNEVQTYQGTIEGKLFSPGKHVLTIIGIDEYGMRSVGKTLELTIDELSAIPKIQKIKLNEPISNDIKMIFKDIKGTNVKLKQPLSINSSIIGFQWIEATLIDYKQKEFTVKIPVNVYSPESTAVNEIDNIMLDAKDTLFGLAEVKKSNAEGTLDDLVRQKVEPKAWKMENGSDIAVELVTNGIKPIFGKYNGIFKTTRLDTNKSLQKSSQLSVGGELKFKTPPGILNFKPTKLGQKNPYTERIDTNWNIEIENTIGANWTLQASSTPLFSKEKKQLRAELIFKNNQNQEVIINKKSQNIATGSETYPIIKWGAANGLLLRVSKSAEIGLYEGTITWSLQDAPG